MMKQDNSPKRAHRLNIVLVEPRIPQNTGNISRTCAVTGAALHMVRPFGFEIDDKKLKRAGLDYWDKLDIYYYDNLEDFFAKNEGEFYFFTTKGRKVHSDAAYPEDKPVYIVFGRKLPIWIMCAAYMPPAKRFLSSGGGTAMPSGIVTQNS